MAEAKFKNYSNCYLYNRVKESNDKELYKFIVSAERIDKSSSGFDDIAYMVKRNQYTSCLSRVLSSNNVVLAYSQLGLPRAFKVFAAKDAPNDGKLRVFIDVTGLIKKEGQTFIIKNNDTPILISYLVSALVHLIYYAEPNRLTNNSMIIQYSTACFAKLTTNIIEYMRIGSVDDIRAKMLYMSTMYYQANHLLKDATSDSCKLRAEKLSGMKGREADVFSVQLSPDDYKDINTFVNAIARVLRVEDSLKVENFVDKWFFLYGAGTQYSLELYPVFSSLLTNAYVGAYINNQKQIEKICGRDMVDYTNAVFRVGSELA